MIIDNMITNKVIFLKNNYGLSLENKILIKEFGRPLPDLCITKQSGSQRCRNKEELTMLLIYGKK